MLDPSKLGEMMKQAQEMQAKMQDELRRRALEGQAGGGLVTVTMNGLFEVTAVKIDPKVVDRNDVALLEDLVRAAVSQATAKVEEARLEQARGMASAFGIPPGMM
jgi:DNA-binding YbaB/EbfC family protein